MLEAFEFVFWEVLKAFALAVAALLAVKAARSLSKPTNRLPALRFVLYALILALVAVAARTLGLDAAAEAYGWASDKNLDRRDYVLAYSNAVRAVTLRPAGLRYWQLLDRAKFDLRQFDSVLRDEPALQRLNARGLDEDDLLRLAYCHYFLGHYSETTALTGQFIARNPGYPKAYVLRAQAELGLRRYPDSERDFMASLQILPTQADAVEGLAHAYFLSGNAAQAGAVLDATSHYSFPPQERDRFRALKSLYEQ